MDDQRLKAAEMRLERLYHEAEIERQRPRYTRVSLRLAALLLRTVRRVERQLESVLNVETTPPQRQAPDVP